MMCQILHYWGQYQSVGFEFSGVYLVLRRTIIGPALFAFVISTVVVKLVHKISSIAFHRGTGAVCGVLKIG